MSFGITKTFPAKEGKAPLEALYDGSVKEYSFHMAGRPSRLQVGDYVYTIYKDHIYGRLQIKYLLIDESDPNASLADTHIVTKAPGEKLAQLIPKKGHGGIQYYDGEDWPS